MNATLEEKVNERERNDLLLEVVKHYVNEHPTASSGDIWEGLVGELDQALDSFCRDRKQNE